MLRRCMEFDQASWSIHLLDVSSIWEIALSTEVTTSTLIMYLNKVIADINLGIPSCSKHDLHIYSDEGWHKIDWKHYW